MTAIFYFDFRSPYSYLAWHETCAMNSGLQDSMELLPYAIELESAYGSPDARDERQMRKVKYLYLDVRRLANERGLVIYGTPKVFDPSRIHAAFLFAKRHGQERELLRIALPKFWRRELDIEDASQVAHELMQCGLDPVAFDAYLANEFESDINAITTKAHELGVFGVPTFALDDEVFWGLERLPMLQSRLQGTSSSR